MPDGRRTTCQHCGRHKDEVGEISWRGKCIECGTRLAEEAADDLHYHRGTKFEIWRRNVILSAGGILPDNLET